MKTQTRRDAFTLIELLVVITIIALLCSLLLAAVFRALTVVKDVQNRNEISQLEAAIASFKNTMQAEYVPSSFDASTPASQFYLTKLFPQCDVTTVTWPGPLEGDQCLVFFLGGARDGSGACVGFSSNPKNPMALPTAGEVRRGPFFDFRANRLAVAASRPAGSWPSYVDVYGTRPFAYFSIGPTGTYTDTDCTGLGVAPYTAGGTYVRNNSFQIISAGVNMRFGPGGAFPTANADGRDDLANFASGKLAYPN